MKRIGGGYIAPNLLQSSGVTASSAAAGASKYRSPYDEEEDEGFLKQTKSKGRK